MIKPQWLVILGMLLHPAMQALGRPVSKKEIVAGYKRAALGAEIKYVDGLLANRADNYIAFGPEGGRQDLSIERERFVMLFSSACRVRLESDILELKTQGDSSDALVTHLLKMEVVDTKFDKMRTKQLLTYAIDRWELIEGVPRMTKTRVLGQYFSMGPPLEEDRIWSLKRVVIPNKVVKKSRKDRTR